jgi:anhydro-N-acetylmuramic acid kinase
MRGERYIGVMSGTSLDGVDAVLAAFDGGAWRTLAAAHRPFAAALRAELLALQASGDDELARAARAANALADAYAAAIAEVLATAGVAAADVVAVGVHGQTVRHRPEQGWTVQLNNPAQVAERCGITVVADFRARDVAAGGQGAPLVPAFHAALFGAAADRIVVNVGGIANLTVIPAGGDAAAVRGFDTGPGNVLMDLWCARHRGEQFDRDGAWARTGRADRALLATMLTDPYFAAAPPKSTGRDRFNADWLAAMLARNAAAGSAGPDPAAVQATLVALTARTVADAIVAAVPSTDAQVLVCGGGAKNPTLMTALAALLAPRTVATTACCGVAVDHVEALAFAWLARQTLAGKPGNLPAVTGARGPRVLGGIYPR